MFAGWGSWVARFRWPVLTVALVAVISSGIWGLGIFSQLTEGGYTDPNSESTHAQEAITDAFGAQGGDLVIIYTPTQGKIDDPALGKAVKDSLAQLPKSAVTASSSYWSTKSSTYAAADKSSAVALITLAGTGDADKLDAYREIGDKFAVPGAKVQLSGATVLADTSSTRSTEDLGKAEAISVPITLILLVLIFGSLVAASLPVLVGGAAVLGSLGILHAIAGVHDVNSFAVNVASLLGLGMAIDYGLFMVGRFREEQADGRTPAEAVARTVGTAGRTVVFSATLLMIALAGLLLFPQGFLKSLAYGGLASVFLAAFLSLTLLPALLAVLGPRVDKLPVRLPGRRNAAEPGSGWTRLAGFVLRRPLLVAIPILAFLLLLAAPIRHVHFGENDERQLPAGDPSRTAIETLKADYPQFTGDSVQIVLRDADDTAGFAVELRQVPGIAQLGVPRKANGVALFTATLKTSDAFSAEARDVVDAIRAIPVPQGATVLVGGTTARNVDSLDATTDRLPLMIGMLVGATLLLMFLAFGSILLPIKAVLMSALSLSATFGLLVWIFQEGHGAGWLDVSPAPLEIGIVVLMAAVVFGLSTDYEVFLLSRMVEARTRGASTNEAVTTGLARTGRVISAAALLLIVVTGAFAMSSITTMRFVGVGMIIALLLDATVVRMLLVPAVLRLLGDAAWWAPGPLRRLQEKAGLAEYETEAPAATTGRHALPDDTQVLTYRPSPFALPAASPDFPWADPEVSGEIVATRALPAADTKHALPAGSNDETQVFTRFEETQVLSLPAAPDARVVADEDPVDAEIVDPISLFTQPDVPVLREFDPEVTATRLAELSGFLPAAPRYDAPASRPSSSEDSFFFGSPGAPPSGPLALPAGLTRFDNPFDKDRPASSIPVIPGMSLPVDPHAEPDRYDKPVTPIFASTAAEPPVGPDQDNNVPAEPVTGSAFEPADPAEFELVASAAAEPIAPTEVEPLTPAGLEPDAADLDPDAAADLGPIGGTASETTASDDFEPSTGTASEPVAEATFESATLAESEPAEPTTSAPTPATDFEPLAPSASEPVATTASSVEAEAEEEPEAFIQARATVPTPAPRDYRYAEPVTAAAVPAEEAASADARAAEEAVSVEEPLPGRWVSGEAADGADESAPEPGDEVYAGASGPRAGGDAPLDEEFYARAAATLFGPDPVTPDYAYAPSASVEAGPTVDLAPRIGAGRPATLADQPPARRSSNRSADTGSSSTPEWQAPLRRPATLGDQPYSQRTILPSPEPQPMTESEPQRPPAAEPVPRRPADLADHLRESRPADLSDYTEGRIPRMRRPLDGPPAEPGFTRRNEGPAAPSPEPSATAKRPATLADHMSRRAETASTRDTTDHDE
ncbi:MMPL family transporter [Paractinoplanes durhamensis]|uniref:Membrane transport protein MMPL domain-containing protein n=1 Tax=Paractinoplanes durhamensis TaxID=113563 RepID=A0ABQ3YRA2_9ACTN|nr:MMPL family transporter [Actinoplanes durhamensis]GIE00039.1 hypothetical protein Adu01nite_13890 [Actinoplanes durhamensis]